MKFYNVYNARYKDYIYKEKFITTLLLPKKSVIKLNKKSTGFKTFLFLLLTKTDKENIIKISFNNIFNILFNSFKYIFYYKRVKI